MACSDIGSLRSKPTCNALFSRPADAAEVGRRYLAAYPTKSSRDVLWADLLETHTACTANASTSEHVFAQWQERDFRDGAVVHSTGGYSRAPKSRCARCCISSNGPSAVRRLPKPRRSTEIRCDICIVGAGAAGITLALALADSGLDVRVLESGGLEPDDATQALYDGESAGMENASPLGCRVRYFGGTTSRWQGWCAPLRDHRLYGALRGCLTAVGRSEEAISIPYYPRAWAMCEVQPDGETETRNALPDFDPAKTRYGFWHYSPPTRFGYRVSRRARGRPEHVSVLLNCNAIKIETDAGCDEVRHLKVAALNGKTGTASRAKRLCSLAAAWRTRVCCC